jgi:DinB superfamily
MTAGETLMTTRFGTFGLALICTAAALVASPAAAQQATATTAAPATLQAALASDVGTLSDKFTGLAKAMTGKYDWRPGPGVRSVGEVFNLIVGENKMLTALLTGAQGGGRGNQITDPAELQEALKTSYAALQAAVAGLSDADLKAPVKLFGRDTTKYGAAMMLIFDQHEHLGQSIAYARSNSVVPPWSK